MITFCLNHDLLDERITMIEVYVDEYRNGG